MRWVCWMAVAGVALAVAGPAAGQVMVSGDQRAPNPYGAPACGAPLYGLAPGCCESPPNCCSNAWDGYCEERARVMSRSERWKQWFEAKACRCWPRRGCEIVVTGVRCEPQDEAEATDASPAPQPPEAPSPTAGEASAPPSQASPLTPAPGRRTGYWRPPITSLH
jgi:hypothetical protein